MTVSNDLIRTGFVCYVNLAVRLFGLNTNNGFFFLIFMGPCIAGIFQCISNKMQRYTVYLYLETALHVPTLPR